VKYLEKEIIKKALYVNSKLHKELKQKALDKDTTIEKITANFLKAQLEKEVDSSG